MRRALDCHPKAMVMICAAATLVGGCAGNPDRQTLAELRNREPDLREAEIDDGIDRAMEGYRRFLEEAPKSALTPEAMRRLADLKLEKEYGLLEAPTVAAVESKVTDRAEEPAERKDPTESDRAFERRATKALVGDYEDASDSISPGDGLDTSNAGPLEAIALYNQILEAHPNYTHNDQVLYQKARAYDELGRVDEAIAVAAELVERFPDSRHLDEVQFRRAEYFFTRKRFIDAEGAYSAIVALGAASDYYELALYKLGWTFYKQMLLDEALETYVVLLDHKVSTGYDFDQTADEADAQRIADTYRVMSLCFSDLGGADSVTSFFSQVGSRSYEDRVYRNLGEFYLEKLRYNDAATVYEAFVALYPIHASSPHFSMRVVEIYEAGNFPKLVLESKKAFAASYGLDSEYWQHFDPAASPEVLAYLKNNLKDLANHYHALYQTSEQPEDKPGHFAESALWYRAYLASFPDDPDTPAIHYQLADLLLENEDFASAAGEYERIAYEYPDGDGSSPDIAELDPGRRERAASAGYAAIFAHREHEKQVDESVREPIRRRAVASTLRFVDRFPGHEHAAAVLGAAVDDLYGLGDANAAIATGHRLIEQFPNAEIAIRRGAWTVIAHASFDTERFEDAEKAYTRVLESTPPDHPTRPEIVNNLAASIYKQGERANQAGDHRTASDHFLRIARAAPESDIRPIAEYDAGAALIRLEDWSRAAEVLEAFRTTFPEHELTREATRQVAFVYRQDGDLARAASEYERVAGEADEPDLRREALLAAGQLYEEAEQLTDALRAYGHYVSEFTHPIEPAVVTRFKMATLYEKTGDEANRRAQLREIVAIDRAAGDDRTPGIRLYAARAALVLTEDRYVEFAQVELTQPFEKSLQEKQRRMNEAISAFSALVDYEVGEITAAATYYMAEVYAEFSRVLLTSERPNDLAAAELADYELVLEEEAYPFEEKSIGVHEKNLELMHAGVFNAWIEKSIARLAEVMPGRYAKFEASPGPIDSIKTYTYQKPAARLPLEIVSEPEVAPESETDTEVDDTIAPPEGAAPLPAAPDPSAPTLEVPDESES